MTRVQSLLLLALLGTRASAQEAPPDFQLYLPDFFEKPFGGAQSVLELPDRPINRLKILVPQASERGITANKLFVLVNGNGVSNALDVRNTAEGMILSMDASSLRMRPDQLFDTRENTVEVLALDRRDRKYYRSWILRTGGAGASPYFAYHGVLSPEDPDGVPPDIVLDEPKVPPVLPTPQASLKLTLKGTIAATRSGAVLKVNGQPALTLDRPSAPFQQVIDVRGDMKEIVLESTDSKRNRRTLVIPILVQQKAAPKTRFAANRYALIVGISRYGDAKGAPSLLPGAAAEARELATVLADSGGFQRDNIRLLLDDEATEARMRIGLKEFVGKAKGDDLLVVFIAGHGLYDPRAASTDKIFFAPYGTQMGQIERTGLAFDEMLTLLGPSVRSNHTFLIFDVGHRQQSADVRLPDRNLVNQRLLHLFPESDGRAVLVSGSADEDSQKRAGTEASSFAYWVGKALSGEADLNRDRVVTAEELFQFVSLKVREDTKGAQNPRFHLPASASAMPLAEAAAK
jgi:hypothetical protein